MTTKETQNGLVHTHLTLPCFPSCENCLAWSDDALAFAGGSNVYLMRRKADAADNLVWTQDSLRINAFTPEDRPELRLATISEFSLGEEQADTVIVALAWSPAGLGLHRRAVLAILTSNLLLAIWETNGGHRGWRRSCLLNHYLPQSNAKVDLHTDVSTPKSPPRIRCFAWSHLYSHPTQPKLASHFIAIADNENNLLLYSIAKRGKHDYGQWSITLLCATRLDLAWYTSKELQNKTALQRVLSQESSINSISISTWQNTNIDGDKGKFEASAVVSCQFPHNGQNSVRSFEITIFGDVSPPTSSFVNTASLKELSESEIHEITTRPRKSTHKGADILYQLDNASKWNKALTPAYCDYSNRNHLNGLVRMRFWGNATSPAHDLEAAAVTIHPYDTYEYTPPASERCHVLFRCLKASQTQSKPRIESEEVVLDRTLDFILRRIDKPQFQWKAIDRGIVQSYYALVSSRPTFHDGRDILKTILENLDRTENGNLVVSAQHTSVAKLPTETCTMCGSAIEMRSPVTSAVCQSGHLFTRCNLSLIAIQQPRISKHCSGCKRQFLDISKLGPSEGPSLARDLFDEFDVCPYCHEKYEG